MKRKTEAITLCIVFGLAFLWACSNQEETPKPKTEVTAEDVKNEAAEAMETAEKYTMAQKEAYMQKIQTRLEEIDRDIEVLGNKIQNGATEMTAEGQAKLQATLKTLQAQKEGVVRQYEELETSGGEAWEELKTGMDAAMKKLNAAFDKAKAEFE
jgi:hypothetical protein